MPRKPPPDETVEVDGRSTRWDDHKAQRRERILQAAIDTINESGSDIGVLQIAERAEVPRSVVYRHFKDRGDLDEAIRARIIDKLMANLAPALTPTGNIAQAIDQAVDTYLDWIVASPKLHQFLGTGSASRRTTGSRVVTGTKTAIAVQLTGLFELMLTSLGHDSVLAESLAFGVIGLVDVSVNRWLAHANSQLPLDKLRGFLAVSIWQVLDGNLRQLGTTLSPQTLISDLL
ncbi:TetR/AcrR family transcriptional regulator [Tomitella biformata]|uniref:TetR/AcrR family transcriptional regulator n=1 Tax=Tomitella biformata TaxID=630403 RepID=UPI0004636D40|nr:TetR/AcrR family transcriptional regulator [Tomitella biformata]